MTRLDESLRERRLPLKKSKPSCVSRTLGGRYARGLLVDSRDLPALQWKIVPISRLQRTVKQTGKSPLEKLLPNLKVAVLIRRFRLDEATALITRTNPGAELTPP